MTTTIVIVLIVLVLIAAAAFFLMRSRQAKRREALQDRFGPEYDRAVESHGDRKAAERRLADAADRRDKIEVRQLQPAERERYSREWTDVQAAFVDSPEQATRHADRLVQSVMRDRGYPVDDFATRAEMLAADHPQVVEHYRAAHSVGSRLGDDAQGSGAGTEELRQAFVHYRALFDLLLDDGARGGDDASMRDDLMADDRTRDDRTMRDDRMTGDDRTMRDDRMRDEGVDLREERTRRTT